MLKSQTQRDDSLLSPLDIRDRLALRDVDWAATNWMLTDREISELLGVSQERVSLNRPTGKAKSAMRRSMEADWSKVNWSLKVETIAYSLRLSVRQVRRMKAKLGKTRKRGVHEEP